MTQEELRAYGYTQQAYEKLLKTEKHFQTIEFCIGEMISRLDKQVSEAQADFDDGKSLITINSSNSLMDEMLKLKEQQAKLA